MARTEQTCSLNDVCNLWSPKRGRSMTKSTAMRRRQSQRSVDVPPTLWDVVQGAPCEFIWKFSEWIAPYIDCGFRPFLVFYSRCSKVTQTQNGNLDDQMDAGLRYLREYGYGIANGLSICDETGPGYITRVAPRPLLDAIAIAKQRRNEGHDVALVTESRCRFIRQCDHWREIPTIAEFKILEELCGGIPLTTILHPDNDAKPEQSKRGQAAKNRRGGRPELKKNRRRRLKFRVLELWAEGNSKRSISKTLGVPRSTVI